MKVYQVFSKASQPAPHGSDLCGCGDYRCQHNDDGFCRVCGNSRAPYDGCTKFRLHRKATSDELQHWREHYGRD